jgi:hypothetical protein
MGLYEVLLGIDRAARDTGRRITMEVRENDSLSAAIKAESKADARLDNPCEYTHAMRVRPVVRPVPPAAAMAMPVPLDMAA